MRYPLHTISNHFFLEEHGRLWLLDTGAPQSFGSKSSLELAGLSFDVPDNYMGLSPDQLSEFVSVDCCGLLGADIWGSFDIVFDQPGNSILLTTEEQEIAGEEITLDDFSGIPIIGVEIDGENYRMFLDTGAQISYFQSESIKAHPRVDSMEDFYPGVGSFQTDVYALPVTLGGQSENLRFGVLPELLAGTLSLAGTHGIIGNELFMGRIVCYRPRRNSLIL